MRRQQQQPLYAAEGRVAEDQTLVERMGDFADRRRQQDASYAKSRRAPTPPRPSTEEEDAMAQETPGEPLTIENDTTQSFLLYRPTDTHPPFEELWFSPGASIAPQPAANVADTAGKSIGVIAQGGKLSEILQKSPHRVRLLTNEEPRETVILEINGEATTRVDPGKRIAFLAQGGELLSVAYEDGSRTPARSVTLHPAEHWTVRNHKLSSGDAPTPTKSSQPKRWCIYIVAALLILALAVAAFLVFSARSTSGAV